MTAEDFLSSHFIPDQIKNPVTIEHVCSQLKIHVHGAS